MRGTRIRSSLRQSWQSTGRPRPQARLRRGIPGEPLERLFPLQQALELYDFHQDKDADCDTQIETALRALAAERTTPTTP